MHHNQLNSFKTGRLTNMLNVKKLSEMNDNNIKPIEFLETGCDRFDSIVGGILKGGITLFTAASGIGKSLTLTHLAGKLIEKNYHILYVSLENLERIDYDRFKNLPYKMNKDNLDYFNFAECLDSVNIMNEIVEAAVNQTYDIIFIDGLDMFITGEDGTSLYNQGNEFAKLLVQASTNTSIVLSWQLNRNANKYKSIADMNIGDISTSIGLVRWSSTVYGIYFDVKDNKRQLCLLKSRTGYNTRNSVIDLNENTGSDINLNNTMIDKVNEYLAKRKLNN